MDIMRKRPTLARALAGLLLATLVSGCAMTWKTVPLEARRVPAGEPIRATLRTGGQVTLPNAFVRNDSLLSARQGYPFSALYEIQVRRSDNTVGWVIAGVAVTGLLVSAAVVAHDVGEGLKRY